MGRGIINMFIGIMNFIITINMPVFFPILIFITILIVLTIIFVKRDYGPQAMMEMNMLVTTLYLMTFLIV